MNIKYALCGVAIAALVTPALAANEYLRSAGYLDDEEVLHRRAEAYDGHYDARGHNRIQDAGRGRDRHEGRQGLRG